MSDRPLMTVNVELAKDRPQPIFFRSTLRAAAEFDDYGDPSTAFWFVESIEEMKRLDRMLRRKLKRKPTTKDVFDYVWREQQH